MDDMLESKVIVQLAKEQYPNLTSINIKERTATINNAVFNIDLSQLDTRISMHRDSETTLALEARLSQIYKNKTQEVKDFISSTALDFEKEVEYKVKGKLALVAKQSNDFSIFQAEALIATAVSGVELTAEQYTLEVLRKANGWVNKNDKAIMKMGAFRVLISSLIKMQRFQEAEDALSKVAVFTAEQIISVTNTELISELGLGGA